MIGSVGCAMSQYAQFVRIPLCVCHCVTHNDTQFVWLHFFVFICVAMFFCDCIIFFVFFCIAMFFCDCDCAWLHKKIVLPHFPFCMFFFQFEKFFNSNREGYLGPRLSLQFIFFGGDTIWQKAILLSRHNNNQLNKLRFADFVCCQHNFEWKRHRIPNFCLL